MQAEETSPAKIKHPFLDYFGGKFRLAPKVIAHFPEHKSYVEPMCGAASILFRKPRSTNEIINDKFDEVVNVMLCVREDSEKLKFLIQNTPFSRTEFYRAYEQSNDRWEQARRTVIKSWFGYGNSVGRKSGFRTSLSKGGPVTGGFLGFSNSLELYASRLRGVVIENRDYQQLLTQYDKPHTLFYIDPPYVLNTRTSGDRYNFDWKNSDHEALVDQLMNIKGKVVLSGYDTPLYDRLGWKKISFKAQTTKGPRVEVLWIKE
jgi:DNA adenine methylase